MRGGLLWAAAVVVLVTVVGFVVVTTPAGRDLVGLGPDPDAAQPIAGADLSGTGPGTLVSAQTMPAFSKTSKASRMNAARVVYRSTEGDTGAPTVVSGSVFTPLGSPPPGGWRVVALGHGTLGIDKPCAPSLSDTLLGSADSVATFVNAGYAVALADYQGLGADGVHPYLDSRTAGRNIIDSVRALKHTFPDVSSQWTALGGSQGGGAVWGAGEQATTYAAEMPPAGVVALAPAADVVGLVEMAQHQTLSKEQMAAMVLIVESLARLHPDLNRDEYRSGLAAAKWDVLISCDGAAAHDREVIINQLQTSDLAPHSAAAADRLRKYLADWALPQQRLASPLSVVYGGKDEYINPAWTTAAIGRACALGGVVAWDLQPDKGHADLDYSSQVSWLGDRFAGNPAVSECVSHA